MSGHALIIGGTGQIGRAIGRALALKGWAVSLTSRSPEACPADLGFEVKSVVKLDRDESGALRQVIDEGADLLVDTLAFDKPHGDDLLSVQDDVGAYVVISSASVYRDEQGRTLDEAFATGFPELPEPITEEQPTVEPGPETYSTRKIALERQLLDGAKRPVTILRPCAIYGPHSKHPREWWFVKRLLDGRSRIPLAYEGRSRFHTSSVHNLAALAAAVADKPVSAILNAVDPQAPSVHDIGQAIMSALGRTAELVGVADSGFPPTMGVSPWSIPRPFVLSGRLAYETGYRPVTDYGRAVVETCQELAQVKNHADWKQLFPQLAVYPFDLFDYDAEDVYFGSHGTE